MTEERIAELACECKSFEHALQLALAEHGWKYDAAHDVWVGEGERCSGTLVRYLECAEAWRLRDHHAFGQVAQDARAIRYEAMRRMAPSERPRGPEVLVCTDASVTGRRKGGWGVLLECGEEHAVAQGPLPRWACVSSDVAETYAVVAGVRQALREWPEADSFLALTDSQETACLLRGRKVRSAKRPEMQRLLAELEQVLGGRTFECHRAHRKAVQDSHKLAPAWRLGRPGGR